MVHDRDDAPSSLVRRCAKCRQGEALPPECVRISGLCDDAPTDCLMANILSSQNTFGDGGNPDTATAAAAAPTGQARNFSAEQHAILSGVSPAIPRSDIMAVCDVIARVLSIPCCEGLLGEDSAASPGRIEDVALLVARSADEWGHGIREQTRGRAWKTQADKDRLMRQAGRIREIAVQIADCARAWGEKRRAKGARSHVDA